MHTHRFTASLAAIPLLCALGASAQEGLPEERVVLTDREAILLEPPVAVAQGPLARWSPSGRFVLAYRQTLDLQAAVQGKQVVPESALVLWALDSRSGRDVWKPRPPGGEVRQGDWLPGSDVAVAIVAQGTLSAVGEPALPQPWLLRIDARRGTTRALTRLPPDARLIISPTQPLAVVYSQDAALCSLVRGDGSLRDVTPALRSIPLRDGRPAISPGGPVMLSEPRWADDRLRVTTFEDGQAYELDLETGALTPLGGPDFGSPAPAATPGLSQVGDLSIKSSRGSASAGETERPLRLLWLEFAGESERPRALVSSESAAGFLSSRADAVLFESEGVWWVRPFVVIDREVYQAMRDAAFRAVMISNMKQLGLGLVMYSQDYDDTLPGAGEGVESFILPYVRNRDLFSGFVYVFPGGSVKDLPDPSKTVLGYAPAPGGRAVVFADGHVEFQPD
jgi:prepilin-type processing-associated H-X9-DG protein